MHDPTIDAELISLWPRLSPRQRDIVADAVAGFESLDTPAARRLAVRYLRGVAAHPERIGAILDRRPCGCDDGFRIVSLPDQPVTVERCRLCTTPPPADLPRSIYTD